MTRVLKLAQERAMQPVYRFAPSPNGHLHLGHAYSALLNARLAHEAGGRFLLRIEDIDTTRCTRALAAEAMEDLAWLGLAWEEPVRFQRGHMDDYAHALAALRAKGLLYPCSCSRQEIARMANPEARDPEGAPIYPGICRSHGPRGNGPYAWRIDTTKAKGPPEWGDVILARKDIGVSYHIAVVTDDGLQGVTDVVRGKDLEAATPIHVMLQRLLNLPTPRYLHHRLITDEDGRKLSKSLASRSLRDLRAAGVTPGEIRTALGFA